MRFLPFLPRFVPLIQSGKKTCTARRQKYGSAGHILESTAGPLRLTKVERVRLSDVRDLHYLSEGVPSPDDFVAVWNEIHPVAGFVPDAMVYLHHFEAL